MLRGRTDYRGTTPLVSLSVRFANMQNGYQSLPLNRYARERNSPHLATADYFCGISNLDVLGYRQRSGFP